MDIISYDLGRRASYKEVVKAMAALVKEGYDHGDDEYDMVLSDLADRLGITKEFRQAVAVLDAE